MCVHNGDSLSECRVSDVIVESRLGERTGYWRLLKVFTDRDLVGTVNLVGLTGEMNPYAWKQ